MHYSPLLYVLQVVYRWITVYTYMKYSQQLYELWRIVV